jgi:dihydropteroate synthase
MNIFLILHPLMNYPMNKSSLFLKLNGELLDLRTPVVMGIVNVTPDSFFAGSRLMHDRAMLQLVEKHLKDGAAIIDVGGYSTRPGAEVVGVDEELQRVGDALKQIRKHFPDARISVDTFRSAVAAMAVKNFGVAMINDISGGTLDMLMFEMVATLKVAYVLMHSRGNPQNMQQLTQYNDLVSEVLHFLENRVARLHLMGVHDVVVDPGFGFAKTLEQNYVLLQKLHYFQSIGVPVLAGVSRKSMIYKLLGTDAAAAINGTTAVHMLALQGGASILRVHDVKEAVEAISIYKAYKNAGNELKKG